MFEKVTSGRWRLWRWESASQHRTRDDMSGGERLGQALGVKISNLFDVLEKGQ